MERIKEKGVSLLEPKNKGVFTVNFKHPILKDDKGNGKVLTKSLGADVGKDIDLANKLVGEIKSIINNQSCYENYYGFLKGQEEYSEKAMNIVFNNTPFNEEYYYDVNKDILEEFINLNSIYRNNKLAKEWNTSFDLVGLERNKYKKKIQLLGGKLKDRKRLVSIILGEDHKGISNKNKFIFGDKRVPNLEVLFEDNAEKLKFVGTLYPECIISEKVDIKKILEEDLGKINSLEDFFEYNLEFREKKSGKRFLFNNEDYNNYSLEEIGELAYIYFELNYKEGFKEKSQKELKEKFLYIMRSFSNDLDKFENNNSLFSDIRLAGDFNTRENLHNKINDFILTDYNGTINELRSYPLPYETRKNLASSDEIIWLFDIGEESFIKNLEILKYLIINGYLNKTKIYAYEDTIYSEAFNLNIHYKQDEFERSFISDLYKGEESFAPNNFKVYLKDIFQNLLEELDEEESSASQKVISGREEYYLNLLLEKVVISYTEEGKELNTEEIVDKLVSNNENKIISSFNNLSELIKEYKPSYKYENLVYLSLGINKELKKEFLKRLNGSKDKNIKEFSLRMAHNFGGREFRNLYPERMLEQLIKNKLISFLLKPDGIRKNINILEYEKLIEYIMESMSERIIKDVELLIKEKSLSKWQEASKSLELESDERRILIEEIIEETFTVDYENLKEDMVLKLLKNALNNSKIFKEIKGELII